MGDKAGGKRRQEAVGKRQLGCAHARKRVSFAPFVGADDQPAEPPLPSFAMIRIDERRSSLRAFAPVLALLAVSVLINYIDRGNLGIAAPLLKAELQISGSQLGVLLAAFFWTYTGLLFVVGWAVDRFEVNRVLAAGFLL